MQNRNNCIIGVVWLLLGMALPTSAQAQPSVGLQNYLVQKELLLKDGGKWKAPSQAFNPQQTEAPQYFGYEFSEGVHPHTLRVKTTGYLPQKAIWITLWDGFYTWDPIRQKAIYHSVSAEGAIATGVLNTVTATEMVWDHAVTLPNGLVQRHRNRQVWQDNQFTANSFIQPNGRQYPQTTFTWSRLEQPKGNLTFMSTRDGNYEIYSMDAKGENLRNLSCNKATDYAFSYAKDGRLAFNTSRDGNDEIYVLSGDGKKLTNLTQHTASDRIPFISPDGTKILFVSDRDHANPEIYVMDSNGANIKRLTNNALFEDAASWSPDGTKIVFSRDVEDTKDSSGKPISNGEIFIMDADGSNVTRLTNRPGFDGGPVFSPDGKQIAFYGKTATHSYEIFVMDMDGSNVKAVTNSALEDYSPAWAPDGQWIAYTSGDAKNYDVWVLHLPTGIKTRLTTQPRRDESPIWQPGK